MFSGSVPVGPRVFHRTDAHTPHYANHLSAEGLLGFGGFFFYTYMKNIAMNIFLKDVLFKDFFV